MKLQYKPSEGCKSSLMPWKSLPLKDIQGLVYGGNTKSFKMKKKPVMNYFT